MTNNHCFNLQKCECNVYKNETLHNKKPIIGITSNFREGQAMLKEQYYKQIEKAGGVPFLIPPLSNESVIINSLEHIDGLLLSGGGDINPLWTNEEPMKELGDMCEERDYPELLITKLAYNKQIPILGICRGMQTIATALGGKVAQDILTCTELKGEDPKKIIKHSQDAGQRECTHSVEIYENTELNKIYKTTKIYVNSFHHQAVSELGAIFKVSAKASDGVIEAMESNEHKPIIGVQWHAEWLESEGLKLFSWLVDEANTYKKAKEIHNKIVSIDTHCDTPMTFCEGTNFYERGNIALVDEHRMQEGRIDNVIMVAYIPQPKGEKTLKDIVNITNSPFEYANLLFDKVEHITKNGNVRIARNYKDLQNFKHLGHKTIMLGIENGLALEGNALNVKHFANRGAVYITLCHNGDNDICDSAKGNNTHKGVSKFGVEVIKEMNKNGIIVDLSHAAEKSFYDAMSISAMPVFCSHSNCKSLCNAPRNLTDDQLLAIKQNNSLVNITFYNGFLCENSLASIENVVEQIDYVVRKIGVQHVGIGSDFDGDGGVCGIKDASEYINITKKLLKKRYNEYDLECIWGGNFKRLINKVQSITE